MAGGPDAAMSTAIEGNPTVTTQSFPSTPSPPSLPVRSDGGGTGSLVDVASWRRWFTSRRGHERWSGWADEHPELRSWSADELVSPVGSARTDAMQAALVALTQRAQGDAAITLLVQLRPGLYRLARWASASNLLPGNESTDEVRAVFYETLCRHPLQRRPRKIAANLILDTRQRLSRAAARRPGTELPGFAASGRAEQRSTDDPSPDLMVISALRSALDRLPGSEASRLVTADVAYRAWILDQPRAAIADDLGLARETVTTRLHRLRIILRQEQLLG